MTHGTDATRSSVPHTGTLGKIQEMEAIIEPSHVAEAKEPSDAPYKGLNPYVEADSSIFFGRKADIQKVVNSLLAWRLTILYGKSGVGKSSLLRAGVTHALNEEARQNITNLDGVPKLAVVVFPSLESGFSWQDDPLTSLTKQIEETIAHSGWDIQPPQSGLPFVETLRGWTAALGGEDNDGELYIILDQFEEYFLFHPQESGQGTFADEFPRAVNSSDLKVNFTISIRDDSFAKLNRFNRTISGLLTHSVRIDHLDWRSAYEAIEEPIKIYNNLSKKSGSVEIKPTLIDAVLKGVSQFLPIGDGRTDNEMLEPQIEAPYLQLVMTRLWEEITPDSRCLDLETLMCLAGKKAEEDDNQIQSAVKNIFRDHLKTALSSLSHREEDLAASVFQYLVTPSGTKYAYSISDLHANYVSNHAGELECTQSELTALLEKL